MPRKQENGLTAYNMPSMAGITIRWRITATGQCRHAVIGREGSVCGIDRSKLEVQALPPPAAGDFYYMACTRCAGGLVRAVEASRLPPDVRIPERLAKRLDLLIKRAGRFVDSARRIAR